MRNTVFGLFFCVLFMNCIPCFSETEIKLRNADFQNFDAQRGLPEGWESDGMTRCEPIPDGVRLTLIKSHKNHSAFSQTIKIENGPVELMLTGLITSDVYRSGYLAVKFYKNHREIKRLGSDSCRGKPTRVRVRFSTEDADEIQIICRMSTSCPVGTVAEFTELKLETVAPGTLGEWVFTSGRGSVTALNPDAPETGFRADLSSSESERFSERGKDILFSQSMTATPTMFKSGEEVEFSAVLEADFVNFGGVKVEQFRDGKLVGEHVSPRNRYLRDRCVTRFPYTDADRIVLSILFDGRQKFHGERVRCSEIYFGKARLENVEFQPPKPTVEVVPGFEVASVYLHHCVAKTDAEIQAELEYRKSVKERKNQWLPAIAPPYIAEERCLRGSLMKLEEGTAYEYRLTVTDAGNDGKNGKKKVYTGKFRTKSGKFKIQKTVVIDAENCDFPFKPTEMGSEEEGYVRYTAKPGFILDAGEESDVAVNLSGAKYVILDGLTIRGGKRHGILIEDAEHVRILNCDISGFGRIGVQRPDLDGKFYLPGDDHHGLNNDSGIRLHGSHAVLVERCFIHDPRGTANSWFYSHPAGPNAVFVGDSTSVCIRWNDFIGSDLHRWNDTIEGAGNGSNWGSVRRDAEISGNYLAFGNDDGMELDGGQVNCRFFMNRTEGHLCGVSTAPCKRGPCYLYHNIFCNPGDVYGFIGVGFKNNYQNIGAGPTYFLSNTILGHTTAFSSPGGNKTEYEMLAEIRPFKAFARNNLAQTGNSTISGDFFRNMRSDFDWNLYAPGAEKSLRDFQRQNPETEAHAVVAEPVFRNAQAGDYMLAENSPGKSAGVAVPNVLPMEKPDMGALVSDTEITSLPFRPAPFTTDKCHVLLEYQNTEEKNTEKDTGYTSQSVEIRATDALTEVVEFQIVQPEGAGFFTVTPESGTLKPGETVTLTVRARTEGIVNARRNCSAFSVRTQTGLSRPISVTVDSCGDADLAEKDRNGAVYGEIQKEADGSVTLKFDVPHDGDYWLFAYGKGEDCMWDSLSLDGGEPMKRITLTPRTAGDTVWRSVASAVFHGAPNRPFPLKKGGHVFHVKPRGGRTLTPTDVAICENPDAFRLNPAMK